MKTNLRRVLLILTITTSALGSLGTEWRQARPGFEFTFPQDHASHPDYKIEWWYYTGNLVDGNGSRFGYQLTFFRVGIVPQPVNASRWAVRDLLMTHFAITDISNKRYRFTDRMNRTGIGWAGAEVDHYRVWNQDWEVRRNEKGSHVLKARSEDMSLDLVLSEGYPAVVHGSQGFSQKGDESGNASHYYSLTRMPTEGELILDGRRLGVHGLSWMDHEFGTSFLEKNQIGWNWFSIQLEDGADLMLFQLRRADGLWDPHSSGTWVASNRMSRSIGSEEFALRPGRYWISPVSGARYPVSWSLSIPTLNLTLDVETAVDGQELRTDQSTGVIYWEGAIEVHGTRSGQRVSGRGYLEMTGYVGKPISERFR